MAKIDSMYNLINTILNDKEVVILLGAGASMEGKQHEHRFPSFDELMDNVLKNFGIVPKTQKERRDSFLAIIEQWEKQNQLSARLHEYLEGDPGLAHYYLTALSIALFGESNALLYLTTNYDDLVINAFSDLKRNPIRRFETVPLSIRPNITGSEFRGITRNVEGHLKEGRPVIVKLFGDLDSQNPIFKKDDMKFEPEVEGKLIEWMRKPMIVIGYSFSDKIMEELFISARGVSPVFLVNPSKKIPNSIKTMDRIHHIERSFSDFIPGILEIIKDKNPSISEKVDKIIESIGLPPIVSKPTGETDKLPIPPRSKTKKKILILASNPKDTGRVRFDEEIREIEDAILRAKKRNRFEIKTRVAVRLRDIRQALLDHEPQIVHFVGHGKNKGLMVENVEGNRVLISTEALSELFKLFSTQIECVILNACFTEPQADAIKKSICYVIGMRRETMDKSAIEFTVGFYDALGAGKSIEDAFQFGRQAVLQVYPDLSEHLVPVLKKRKDKKIDL